MNDMRRAREVLKLLLRSSVQVGVATLGFILLAVGIVLLFLPGPGLLVVIAGLAVLATQFAWAERALRQVKVRAARAKAAAQRRRHHGRTESETKSRTGS